MRDDIPIDGESGIAEELSVRQQGRLRHKKALIAKLQKGESRPATPGSPGEEPEPKKVKPDRPVDGDKMDEE